MTNLRISSNALVILVGCSGSGKSTLAKRHFPRESIVSSDQCRRLIKHGKLDMVCSEADLQEYNDGAFLIFHNWIRAKLKYNMLTVVDATNTTDKARTNIENIAKEQHKPIVYIILTTPPVSCISNDKLRPFPVGEKVIEKQYLQLIHSLDTFKNKKDMSVYYLDNIDDIYIENTTVSYALELTIPIHHKKIDIIGDVHGCLDILKELLIKLGYTTNNDDFYAHPERIFVLTGDVIDRGPDPYLTFEFVRTHVEFGYALTVMGNHENKFARYLAGRDVKIKHGLQKTIDQLNYFNEDGSFNLEDMKAFLFKLPPYLIYEGLSKPIVITHAAFKKEYLGRRDKEVKDYCMYGPTCGRDPNDFPIRIPWEDTYDGPTVVYGHVVSEDEQIKITNNTYGIDTGAVFGGSLSALRLPEFDIVSIPAKQTYFGRYADG